MSAQDRGWGPPCPDSQIVRISAGGRSFNVHRKVATIFQVFIHELTTRTNYPIDEGTLDDWSYNCRKIAGSTAWSNHAWGLAVDINSIRNPMKAPPMITDMPAWVRNADYLLSKYGLKWGGTYQTRPDPMHYEFILTPGDADRITATLSTFSTAAPEEWYMADIPASNLAQIQTQVEEGVRKVFRITAGESMDVIQFGQINNDRAFQILAEYGKAIRAWQATTAIPTASEIAAEVVAQLPEGDPATTAAIAAAFEQVLKRLIITVEESEPSTPG